MIGKVVKFAFSGYKAQFKSPLIVCYLSHLYWYMYKAYCTAYFNHLVLSCESPAGTSMKTKNMSVQSSPVFVPSQRQSNRVVYNHWTGLLDSLFFGNFLHWNVVEAVLTAPSMHNNEV